jgi:hypothetical protein
MPFDLYTLKPATPDHRCGHDIHITYAECGQQVFATAVGVQCPICRREVAQFEWEAMESPRGMRVSGGAA